MEMAVLEPRERKKTAGASNYMQDEEINRIEGQRYVGCCYCCVKRGHMASQCHFRAYKCHKCSKLRQAIYKQFVQKIRIHRERSRNLKNNVAKGALKVSDNFRRSSRGKSRIGKNWWTQGRL